jgi:hypothetical protein
MQQMMEESNISPKKKDAWLAFGIVLCVIFANEVDGMEWRTLVDGNREAPILLNTSTGEWIDPMKLVWSKAKEDAKVIAAGMKNEAIKDAVANGQIPEIVALIAYLNSLK